VSGRLLVVWNVLKAWALLTGGCALLGTIGWALGGYQLASLLVFFALLVAGAAYWYGDRVASCRWVSRRRCTRGSSGWRASRMCRSRGSICCRTAIRGP
jgi:hypothetical protein